MINGSLFAEERKELSKKLSLAHTLYFVGIGGSGMYGCARLARDLGFSVMGEDAKENENTKRLSLAGFPITKGNAPLPDGVDVVVYTLAVKHDHPVLKEARARGIPAVSRNVFLGALTERFPICVAISGSHGKSSTTGMCAEIFARAKLSPTVLIGADLSPCEGGYRRGDGRILLVEACEYRDAFLSLSPTHAVVLNAEWEHTDYFRDEGSVRLSFSRFLNNPRVCCRIANGALAMSADVVFRSPNGIHARGITFRDGKASFDVHKGKEKISELSLSVLGVHQVDNALAAFAVAESLGIDREVTAAALNAYHGVGGRLEYRGTLGGASLYLDYAHHPTELRAAFESAKAISERVICVFEPHTFSRVHAFYKEFKELLSLPAACGVLPIYAAREKNVFGVSAEKLAKDSGAVFLPSFASAAMFLRENAKENSVLLLVGAGDVREVLRFTE